MGSGKSKPVRGDGSSVTSNANRRTLPSTCTYHLIREAVTGNVLASKGGAFVTATLGDDATMFVRLQDAEREGEVRCTAWRNVVSGMVIWGTPASLPEPNLFIAPNEHNSCFTLSDANGPLSVNGQAASAVYTVVDGPDKLPSQHLHDMRSTGYTVLPNVLPPDSVDALEKILYSEGHDDSLAKTPIVARALAHPVAVYLFQEYLGDFRLGHAPCIRMKPGGGFVEFDWWHTDYPYNRHWTYPITGNYQVPFTGEPQGLQYNICVHEFRPENAATQYLPGSHASGKGVPKEWNKSPDLKKGRPGKGVHPDVKHMIAPPGAGILYDARTWHRPCPECNEMDTDRIVILNAITTPQHPPRTPKEAAFAHYNESGIPERLTERERDAVAHLMQTDPVGRGWIPFF